MLSSLQFTNSDSVDRIGLMNIVHQPNKMATETEYSNLLNKNELTRKYTNIQQLNGIIGNSDHQRVTYYLLNNINNNNNNNIDCNLIKNCNKIRKIQWNKNEMDDDDSNGSETIDVASCELNRNRNPPSGDEKAPDHHARRPMNAFLIFCKRHRGIVREKYPNLENRSITKILGDWWANLDRDEKLCYTDLAKQYKDAFLSANPTFKWYKLPAPPLRTLPTQSSHSTGSERSDSLSDPYDYDIEPLPNKRTIETKSNMGMFKLADEAQMGGLSSLMRAVEVISGKVSTEKINENRQNVNQKNFDQLALHNELAKTHSFMKKTINGNGENLETYSSVPYHINAMFEHKNIPTKAYYKQEHSPDKNFEFDFYDDDGSSGDNCFGTAKKSSRACKGKRYLEFMNANRINPITKKSKQRTNSSSSSSTSLSPVENVLRSTKQINGITRKIDSDPIDHTINECASKRPQTEHNRKCINDNNKSFDANDFDLEEKINALPSRSLDKYLSCKRDTKKKKRVNGRRTNITSKKNALNKNRANAETKKSTIENDEQSPRTIEEAKERLMMVGSKKRKARKESITRRVSIEVKVESDVKIQSTNCASNLLFLATVAEANASLGV